MNVSRWTPIPDAIAHTNSKYQAILPAPWSYYQLVAAVNPNTPGSPPPGCTVPFNPSVSPNVCVASNTTMESYKQSTSCLTCHAKGTPQGVTTPNIKDFQIFTFLLQEAQPAPSTRAKPAAASPKRY